MIKVNRIILAAALLFMNGCVSLSVGEKLSERINNKPDKVRVFFDYINLNQDLSLSIYLQYKK